MAAVTFFIFLFFLSFVADEAEEESDRSSPLRPYYDDCPDAQPELLDVSFSSDDNVGVASQSSSATVPYAGEFSWSWVLLTGDFTCSSEVK